MSCFGRLVRYPPPPLLISNEVDYAARRPLDLRRARPHLACRSLFSAAEMTCQNFDIGTPLHFLARNRKPSATLITAVPGDHEL
jgi:hypothetical protein